MKKLCAAVLLFTFFGGVAYPQQFGNDLRSLVSSEGKVLYGEEPNSIMVMDFPENINRIAEYLDAVDVEPQQVLIEARVVEVRLSGEKSLGVNWQLFGSDGLKVNNTRVGSAEAGTFNPRYPLEQAIPYKSTTTPGSAIPEDPFTFAIFNANINVVLSALANAYNTDILSAPRVTTVNNRAAEIRIIQSLPWAEPTVAVSEYGYQTITWEVTFESIGITLQVTPTINENGDITMTLNPEVSEKVDDYTLSVIDKDGNPIPYSVPVIDRRTAATKVVMKNGQTLILGGLIRNKMVKKETKVPFFGDMPFVGSLFKSQYDSNEKQELIIFVSPTIINAAEMARSEKLWQYGPGRAGYQDRQRQDKMLLALAKEDQEKKVKMAAQWDALVKQQKDLSEQTKKLQDSLKKEEANLKDLEAQKEAVIKKKESLVKP